MNTTHDPVICPDCTAVMAEAPSGFRAVGIRMCKAGRDQSARTLAQARRANPDIDAIHRMLEGGRS